MMLEIRTLDNICIIKIMCELTHTNLVELRETIEEKSKEDFKVYLLNLESCTYINSQGFGYIVDLHRKLKSERKKLVISNLVPDVRKLFEITKMNVIIEVYKNEKEALERL